MVSTHGALLLVLSSWCSSGGASSPPLASSSSPSSSSSWCYSCSCSCCILRFTRVSTHYLTGRVVPSCATRTHCLCFAIWRSRIWFGVQVRCTPQPPPHDCTHRLLLIPFGVPLVGGLKKNPIHYPNVGWSTNLNRTIQQSVIESLLGGLERGDVAAFSIACNVLGKELGKDKPDGG